MSLSGQVALVTGGSRGIGKGIAEALGNAGATVYITGRYPNKPDNKISSLEKTAEEIISNGGKCIVAYCDHSNHTSVKELFEKIDQEQNGQLDILVNNAYSAVEYIFSNTGKKFYELEPEKSFDIVNNVGLKNHYICAIYGSRMMIKRKKGLIITISSSGGMGYLFNISYGLGKAACDRLAADIAVDLAPFNITSISLWPGPVRTETVQEMVLTSNKTTDKTKSIFDHGESTKFAGKCIVELAKDNTVIQDTGKILTTADLARKYNIRDDDGRQPQLINSRFKKYLDTVNEIRYWKNAKLNAKI